MVALVSANWLGDFAALTVLLLAGYFLQKTWDLHEPSMWLFSLWFLLIILFPVYSQAAWRAAFVALVPLTVMAGWSLAKLFPKRVLPSNFTKVMFVLVILGVPTFGSWGNVNLMSSSYAQGTVSSQQQSDLQAIQWIVNNVPKHCENDTISACPFVSVNDYDFLFLPYMGGGNVYYAPFNYVLFNEPLQVQEFSANLSRYLIVSRTGTIDAGSCDPRYTLGLTINATVTGNNAVIQVYSPLKVNDTVIELLDNSTLSRFTLENGYVRITGPLNKGMNSIIAAIGDAATTPMNLVRGGGFYSSSVPSDWCSVWNVFNPATMLGWSVVYSDGNNVRIYNETA
jgi:hypothetical protein